MADNKKVYSIEINGIKESIDAVKSLTASLGELETRIDALKAKASVNVSVNGNVQTNTSSSSDLKEQDNLEKQILATEEKLAQVRSENYQKLLHMKEELKEYTQIAKSNAAADENKQGLFDTNTMAGMKASLKSIKAEMQTLDVSSDRFRELTQEANVLNEKLKSIEQSYGQFGRNVGNYANGVSDGLKKLNIDIGGVAQEFDNAKQALMALKKEMQTLSVKKDLGIISEEETERLKSLIPTVKQLESSIKDAGKPMDALMDTMQGIVAIASTAQGLGALFGFDDTKIEETIKKLVALQNVLQGLQTLQTQMQEQQGIGLFLSKGSAAADKLAASIVGVSKATKTATVATKALSLAFKGLGIGLIITAVTALMSLYDKFVEKQKKAAEETKRAQEVAKKSAVAYNMAKQELTTYASIIDNFNGTKKEEKKLVDELNKKYGQALGTYKSLAQWKDTLIKKTEAYCEVLAIEAEMAAATHRLEEAYSAQMDAKNYDPSIWERILEGSAAAKIRVQAAADQEVKEAEKAQAEIFKKLQAKKQESGLFDFSPQVDKDGKKTKKAVLDVETELNRIRIEAMREGLNKTIAQLEEDKRQRINKIKANGQNVAELTKATEQLYQQKIEDARKDFAEKIEKEERDMWQEIGRIGSNGAALASENIVKASENSLDKGIDRLQKKLNKIYVDYAPDFGNVSNKTLAKAGNIEGKIKTGELKDESGEPIDEEELELLKKYQGILENIDSIEGEIYLFQRRRKEEGVIKIYDENALRTAEDGIKSLREELEKLIKTQNEGKNIDYEAGFNALYGGDIEEFKKQLAAKIQAEKDAANESYEIEKKRIQDEAKLREEAYAKDKYKELNSLASDKEYEERPLKNKLKLQEITIKEYNEEIAKIEAKYAQLAMDTEIKYGVEIENFTVETNKKLKELEEKHRQELLDIDKKYDGDVEKQRKAAFDNYVKSVDDYYADVEKKVEAAKAKIAELEAKRNDILNNPTEVSSGNSMIDAVIGQLQVELAKYKKIKDDYLKELDVSEKEIEESYVLGALRDENYASDLSQQFIARLGNHIKYYDEVEKLEKKHWDTVLAEQKTALSAQTESEKTAAKNRLRELKENIKKQEDYELNSVNTEEEKEAVREKYRKQRVAAEKNTEDYIKQLDEQFNKDIERAEIEHQNNIRQTVTRSQDNIIGEYRDFYSKLSNVQSSLPITNDFGIINLSKTKKRNKELLESFSRLGNQIHNQKIELQEKLDANEIEFDDFTQARRELNDLETSVAASLDKIEEDIKDLPRDWWETINQWIQLIGQSMNSILGSLSEISDNHYQAEIDKQEKYIEKYEELLSKQREITQQYADEVESIEDELATARGDRRQHLIDQLNAEMAAQRASLAQEKKIEAEKKKAEEKQKKLEHDQAVKKKKMQLAQAYINMAMSVSMAAVNNWPIPAIPMMALAAATGAAQIAAIQSQNIPSYGSGGVIQGKSHKEGGVKVLGGRAEVEGGEFITNKATTAKNVELLEYINGKKRKVNLEDLIEFYGGTSVKKNIQGIRTKFADGGVIPTLRSDITVNDRILNAIEDYSNKPTVVSVVDIIDRTQRVNDVKVMAGLDY